MKKIQTLFTSLTTTLAVSAASLVVPGALAQIQPLKTVSDSSRAATEIPAPPTDTLPHIDSDLVRERLAKLEKQIPLIYNAYSHQYVEYFTFRKAAFTKTMLERMNTYFPIYEKYLAQYGLPDELKYLSLIESGLNPRAISYANAGGLWQFMPRTATLDFGLRMDQYVDERFDPIKSTEAACKYFRQLYRIFGDWEMVLASYNTGPGNVKRAIRRSGNRTGFWEIYNQLPAQTRSYVPQYVGILYMMHHAADHGIRAELIENPMPFDTVHINGYVNLQTLSGLSQIPYEKLQKLNPHILTNILPAHTRGFALRIPSDHYTYLTANRVAILDSASRNSFDSGTRYASVLNDSTQERKVANVTVEEEPEVVVRHKPKKVYLKVRRGETLSRIADRYNVDVSSLKQWNHLGRRSTLKAGQKLVVYQKSAVTQTGRLAKTVRKSRDAGRSTEIAKRLKARARYHTVQRGDTLWSIAQRYGSVTINDLKRLNGIRGSSVKPGMKIRVS
ncbi:MAG: LysM peptidoglycan-binding domain-containing protein [Cytophagaceae bacterium]|nr:LysM peptidoglycan-binding domain-containing protein [Cytophagaceae bacterium]